MILDIFLICQQQQKILQFKINKKYRVHIQHIRLTNFNQLKLQIIIFKMFIIMINIPKIILKKIFPIPFNSNWNIDIKNIKLITNFLKKTQIYLNFILIILKNIIDYHKNMVNMI